MKFLRGVDPAPASRLGITRVLVGGYTVVYLARRRGVLQGTARTEARLFAPVGPVRVLRSPMPVPVADAIYDATIVSSALFALGVKHRLLSPVHALLLSWTLSYPNSWSMIHHSDNTLVLHTAVLAASPAAHATSLDALFAGSPPAPHARYGWPLRLMRTTSAVTYLLAGVAKVRGGSGWGWVRGDQLRRHVAVNAIRKEVTGETAPRAGYALYPHRSLFTALAVISLALELCAPLALLNRTLGRLWAVSTFGMHWGIRLIMGIHFRYQQAGISFASWFDLEYLLRGARKPHLWKLRD